jgi:hypothetical protein
MEKLLIILLSSLSLTAFAQTTPNWYDNDMRQQYYPAGQYFIGFAEGQRTSGESLEVAIQRLKDAAKVEAASTIQVHVRNTTVNQALSQTLHNMEGTFRQSVREFSSTTQTSVDMEIPGLQIESWQNPVNGNIAAFAYVKKSILIRQLEKKITVCLTKTGTALEQIDQLIATGQKMQAREVAMKTLPYFIELEETQKLLAAVDEYADEESLQLQDTRSLQQRLTGVIAQLKNGISICLMCNASLFGSNYNALMNEIKGELSKMGCNFVNEETQSDWTIRIIADARKYNVVTIGNNQQYFCYVDAEITIKNVTTGQIIYENQISEKGGHPFDYENAARDAYKYISPKISEIIKKQIRQ